jgi:hypothetical protein
MSIFNPLNAGPTQPAPYVQPNTANPTANPLVGSFAVGANTLNLTWPIPEYTQPNYPTNVPASGVGCPAFPLGTP